MKKQFVLGMVLASFLAAPVASLAAPSPAKAQMEKYVETLKAHGEKMASAHSDKLSDVSKTIGLDKAISDMRLNDKEAAAIRKSLGSDKAIQSEMVKTVTMLVGLREFGGGLGKSDSSLEAEGQKIKDFAEAHLMALKNADLVGNNSSLADVTAALKKRNSIIESIAKMDVTERDSYTAVAKKEAEIIAKDVTISGEEAFIQAVMAVKGVSREKALEIARKLKDCV